MLHRFRHCLLPALLALLLGALLPTSARAVEPDEILADQVLEQRARQISAGLRCLVCQNQSIDDSNAPLARDLRILVRERLKQGDSDAAVNAYIVARYGEFALLRPPLSVRTVMLWLAPLLLIGVAVFFVMRRAWAQAPSAAAQSEPLTAAEQARLDTLLEAGRMRER